MPRGDELHEEVRFSDREDDAEDLGYGGGASYDDDEEEDGGWMTHKDDSDDLWDSTEDAEEEEEETEVFAESGEEEEDLFGAAPAPAVPAKPVEKVGHGFTSGEFRCGSGGHAVDRPLAQHKLHDRLTPSRERHGRGKVIGVATAADQRRIAHPPRGLVERAAR